MILKIFEHYKVAGNLPTNKKVRKYSRYQERWDHAQAWLKECERE
ncbi:hypothetical protein [Spiroplasma endosymbiont of Dromius quadrimaculatus]